MAEQELREDDDDDFHYLDLERGGSDTASGGGRQL
jgi:hypothetical protein